MENFTRWPYLQRLWAAHTRPILMNGGILKYQKLLAELPIKLHMSNQQQQSEINCPMNVVSYTKIAFKRLIFFRVDEKFQPMHKRSHNVLIMRMCIGWFSQVSMGNLALSFRRWDYFSILRVAVSSVHKYRREPSLYFYGNFK